VEKVKVLFLASVPSTPDQTENLEKERKLIESVLAAARYREWFGDYIYRTVLEFSDFEKYLKEAQPTIFHFSGHGHENGELKLGERFIPIDFLGKVFADASTHVKCVTLSSCYSEAQAKEIAKSVPCVVGTNNRIRYPNAIKFIDYFYREIGDGKTVNTAFQKAQDLVNAQVAGLGELMVLLPTKESGKELVLVPVSLALALVDALETAQYTGEEGEKSGGNIMQGKLYSEYYRYNLELKQVSLLSYSSSFESEKYFQNYVIDGQWSSAVSLERWVFNPIKRKPFLIDTPWGPNKHPEGSFTAEVQTVDGVLTQTEVHINRHDDNPNNYAAEKVKLLIESKIREVVPLM
jgi:hypothetical protein